MSPSARIGAQRPRRHRLPRHQVASDGPDAIEFALSLGYELDDWQRWCIDGILSTDAEYRLCATLCLILVSRQNGKNVILEVVELYAFYVLDWPVILHTAHRADTSAVHMMRMRTTIEANLELAEITTFIVANGKEKIVRNDTRAEINFVTRSKKIGRGRSPRMVIFDEALYLSDEQLQAILPSMSAQSLSDDAPLMIYTSSAPVPESTVLHRLINQFATSDTDGFFADWGAAPGVDVSDRDVWYETNPGLGIRISEEWVAERELAMLTPEAFAIERLGVVFAADKMPSELPEWPTCADAMSTRSGRIVIGVDVALDLSWSSIAIAGLRDDGLTHVEIVQCLPGISQTVEIVAKMAAQHEADVWLNIRSEAAGLVRGLTEAGARVVEVGGMDFMRACVQFRQQVTAGQLRHRSQDVLNVAVAGAAVRPVGDGWVWAGRTSRVDISPLMAVTLAAWGLTAVVAGKPFEFFVY